MGKCECDRLKGNPCGPLRPNTINVTMPLEMSDTVRQEYQDKLGAKFGAVFCDLRNDWASGLVRANEFRELFSNAERVELLNAISGGGFLWDMQHILWDDLMLRVSRLTDPIQTAGKDNLTVQLLPPFCVEPQLREEVRILADAAVEATKFARDWRNRHISHADLARAIEPNAEPLAQASLGQVAAALDAVHAVLNVISVRKLNAEIMNKVVFPPRARAFVCYATQLVEAVRYIDSLIDPSGTVPITDSDVISAFLLKLGCRPTAEQVMQIIELREAARRFK